MTPLAFISSGQRAAEGSDSHRVSPGKRLFHTLGSYRKGLPCPALCPDGGVDRAAPSAFATPPGSRARTLAPSSKALTREVLAGCRSAADIVCGLCSCKAPGWPAPHAFGDIVGSDGIVDASAGRLEPADHARRHGSRRQLRQRGGYWSLTFARENKPDSRVSVVLSQRRPSRAAQAGTRSRLRSDHSFGAGGPSRGALRSRLYASPCVSVRSTHGEAGAYAPLRSGGPRRRPRLRPNHRTPRSAQPGASAAPSRHHPGEPQ